MQTRITKKWHDQHEIAWQELVFYAPPTSYLEIGSYEGASAIWMAKNNKRIRSITCIDNWSNNDEHQDTDMIQVEVNFRHNIKLMEQEYRNISFDVYKMPSHRGLAHLMGKTLMYDWIYIDGSHRAADVLSDLTMAWHLLHPTGIMILDDYAWPSIEQLSFNQVDIYKCPKLGIDSWMQVHKDYTIWPQTGYQMIIQKN